MEEFNSWMLERYGYSWYQHKRKLLNEGFNNTDITEELVGLTYVYCVLEVGVNK